MPQPALAEPGQAPVSRHYSRPVVYSTSPANCVAQGALALASRLLSRPLPPAITRRGTTRRALLSSPNFSLLSLISVQHASTCPRSSRSQSRSPNPLSPLPLSNRHRCHQNEMLRHLLRLQRLPRSPSQPLHRTLAPIRMAPPCHSLRRLLRRANNLRLPPVQLRVPQLPRPLQSRLS